MTAMLFRLPNAAPRLRITVVRRGGVAVLALAGELVHYTAELLRDEIINQIALNHRRLVVDLRYVDFMDSSGLGVLCGALKRSRAHDGVFLLANATNRVTAMLRITGVDRVLQNFPDLDMACAAAFDPELLVELSGTPRPAGYYAEAPTLPACPDTDTTGWGER